MAEVSVIQAKTQSLIMQKIRAVLLCLLVAFAASIANVYLQYFLNEFFRTGSPVFVKLLDDGVDELLACVLFFACGLTCFGVFLYFCRTSYKTLPLNVVSTILTTIYGFAAHFWLFHWNFGFEHWSHIAVIQVPFIVASTIYPASLAVMYILTLLTAKILEKKADVNESNINLKRDYLTLLAIVLVSLGVWFSLYGTISPYFAPTSLFK